MFGFGTEALRWIPTDATLRMDVARAAERRSRPTARTASCPFLVVATGGSVSTGAVDPLRELAAFCREEDLWLHVDGAYGAFAAAAPERARRPARARRGRLDRARPAQVALHAGRGRLRARPQRRRPARHVRLHAALLPPRRGRAPLLQARAAELARLPRAQGLALAAPPRPRGLRRADRATTCALARELDELVDATPDARARAGRAQHLDVPVRRRRRHVGRGAGRAQRPRSSTALQAGGEAFVSIALVDGRHWLRSCIVNFRTTRADLEALVALVQRLGAEALARAVEEHAAVRDRAAHADRLVDADRRRVLAAHEEAHGRRARRAGSGTGRACRAARSPGRALPGRPRPAAPGRRAASMRTPPP